MGFGINHKRVAKGLVLAPKDEVKTEAKEPELDTKQGKAKPRSKKHTLPKLPADWRDRMWEMQRATFESQPGCNKGKFSFAVALLIATGLRPEELGQGVRLKRSGKHLEIEIQGGKFCRGNKKIGDRGLETRTLIFDLDTHGADSPHRFIAENMGGVEAGFKYNKETLRRKVRELGNRYLLTVKKKALEGVSISPYCFRHAMGSDLKSCGDLSKAEMAMVMGHLSTKSLQSYGKARRTKNKSPVAGVRASDTPKSKEPGKLFSTFFPEGDSDLASDLLKAPDVQSTPSEASAFRVDGTPK